MTKLIVLLLLASPAFVRGADTITVKPPDILAGTINNTDIFRTIAAELLKPCEGAGRKIAVAGFAYTDGRDSADGGVVAERITAELVRLNKIKVIEQKEVERALKELRPERSGFTDADPARETGKILGADWIAAGTLTELPDKLLELKARLVAVGSGKIVAAVNTRLGKDWPDRAGSPPAEESRNTDLAGKAPVTDPGPPGADAYIVKGRAYFDMKEYDKAIGELNKALENIKGLDDMLSCVEAYKCRALVYHEMGEFGKALNDLSMAATLDARLLPELQPLIDENLNELRTIYSGR